MVTFALAINIYHRHYLKNHIYIKHCFYVSYKVESAHDMYALSKLILGDVFLQQQTNFANRCLATVGCY